MNLRIALATVAIFSSLCFAKQAEKPLLIYKCSKAKAEIVKLSDPILPHRVYVKFFPKLKTWLYAKTDDRSNFPKPSETLQPGTVLPGTQIGGEVLSHFKLNEKGFWEKTQEPLREFVRVDAKVPYVKVVMFEKMRPEEVPLAPPPPSESAGK